MASGSKSDRTRRLVERDGGICHLCGGEVRPDLDPNHPLYPSRDHIIPQAVAGKGYADHETSLAHRACNEYRGTKRIVACKRTDFAAHLKIVMSQQAKRKLGSRPTTSKNNKYVKEL